MLISEQIRELYDYIPRLDWFSDEELEALYREASMYFEKGDCRYVDVFENLVFMRSITKEKVSHK